MVFVNQSCSEFVNVLASKAPVPGGGGASALVGAVGIALGTMVGNLTVGKKKYADVEADIYGLMDKAYAIQKDLLRLIDDDAYVFEPLSKAYGVPKDHPYRDEIMENALRTACSVPLDIMRACAKAIEIHEEYAAKGSALAISDVGVGVICCKAALLGANLNVMINTKAMKDRTNATRIEKEANALVEKYSALADNIYESVVTRLR